MQWKYVGVHTLCWFSTSDCTIQTFASSTLASSTLINHSHAHPSRLQVSPLRYTGRVVMVRDHFGFIQCQDLPTEADEVSRWGHKAIEGEEEKKEAEGKHDAAKRKKKSGNRFQIFFSLAEVEGETEVKGGDEVEFVVGVHKGDRVARRVRFKSRPAPLEPSATPLGERRKLFVNVCEQDACVCRETAVLFILCTLHQHTDTTESRRHGAHAPGGHAHPQGP